MNIPSIEIIVSIDGSTDDTLTAIQDIKNNIVSNTKLVYTYGSNAGRAVSRNRGAELASGSLLIFFDDDVIITDNTIQEHIKFHSKYIDENIIADGPALYDLSNIDSDFQFWRATRETSWYIKSSIPLIKTDAGLVGANKSIKTSFFKRLGGFKLDLTDSEDFDFAYRAMHNFNGKIFTIYNAWVYHDDTKNLKEYVTRYRQAMISAYNLYTRNPEIIIKYPERWVFDSPLHLRYLKYIFSSSIFINICTSSFFLKLPKLLRWKIYEWVVTSYSYYTIINRK